MRCAVAGSPRSPTMVWVAAPAAVAKPAMRSRPGLLEPVCSRSPMPGPARRRATDAPMPDPAPVITATRCGAAVIWLSAGRSFFFDHPGFQQLVELCDFALDDPVESLGRAAGRFEAELIEPRLDVGHAERLVHLAVELIDDGPRHAARSLQPVPDARLRVLDAVLCERGNVRQHRHAPGCCDGDAAHAIGPDLRLARHRGRIDEVYLAADQVRHVLHRAFVWD